MNNTETRLSQSVLRIRLKRSAQLRVPEKLREEDYPVVKTSELGFGISLKDGSMIHIFPEECL